MNRPHSVASFLFPPKTEINGWSAEVAEGGRNKRFPLSQPHKDVTPVLRQITYMLKGIHIWHLRNNVKLYEIYVREESLKDVPIDKYRKICCER